MSKPGLLTFRDKRGEVRDCPRGIRRVGGAKLDQAFGTERENLCCDAKGEAKRLNPRG
jgi:hypothetical protein